MSPEKSMVTVRNKIPENIVFYDGVCVLCNRFMQFVIRADRKERLHFSTLQSEFAKQVFAHSDFDHTALKTMVFKKGDRILIESTGALNIYKTLGFPWSILYVFIVVPPFIRNAVYRFIAKYRYTWFGKEDHCIIPDASMNSRIL